MNGKVDEEGNFSVGGNNGQLFGMDAFMAEIKATMAEIETAENSIPTAKQGVTKAVTGLMSTETGTTKVKDDSVYASMLKALIEASKNSGMKGAKSITSGLIATNGLSLSKSMKCAKNLNDFWMLINSYDTQSSKFKRHFNKPNYLVEDMYEKDDGLMILFKGGKEVFINNSGVYHNIDMKKGEEVSLDEKTWVDVEKPCNYHDFNFDIY